MLKVADFFCGAGGFSEGFRQKGFEVAFALDNWKPAIETHELNHPHCRHELMDILELDTPAKIDAVVPDTDIIIGSPPCVSFSGSNKAGKADKSLGVRLIQAYLRIVAWKKSKGVAKYWLMENVPNSRLYVKDRYTWNELGLPGQGPDLIIPQKSILNAAEYGAPQGRRRFVCGEYPLPKKTHEDNQLTMAHVLTHLTNPMSKINPSEIIDPIYGIKIDASELTDHFYDSRVSDFEWQRAKRLKDNHGFMGKMSFPEELDRPSRTVMATLSASTRESMIFDAVDDKGKHIGYRLPTIREIASFMSFPIDYQFEAGSMGAKYRLVGNAVCARMSAALAEAIAREENIRVPTALPPLHKGKPSFDLTGIQRESKIAKEKPLSSKFEEHVPYLKIKGMRVQLSNLVSDFSTERFLWECQIRYGSAKNHKSTIISLKDWETAISQDEKSRLVSSGRFDIFKKDVQQSFTSKIPDAKDFQSLFCRRVETGISPYGVLKRIKELVDKHYPEKTFLQYEINNGNGALGIDRESVPMRIAAAAYACSFVTSQIKRN